MQESEGIGVIAGGGQFPLMIADSARRQGKRVIAVAHRGETDPSLSDKAHTITWINLGQFGLLIKALRDNGVRRALMAGSISKRRMFELRPDGKGLALMSKLAIFHDDDILRAVAGELEKEGIEVIGCGTYLPELLAKAGCLTKRKPRKAEKEDVRLGWETVKELGRLDIGQCVVVRNRTVLAVEALEGTDATIKRGAEMAGEKAVVVKASKPGQDLRFDVPSVGLGTVRTMSQAGAALLAIEAEKTLLFDKTETVNFANKAGICIVACSQSDKGLHF